MKKFAASIIIFFISLTTFASITDKDSLGFRCNDIAEKLYQIRKNYNNYECEEYVSYYKFDTAGIEIMSEKFLNAQLTLDDAVKDLENAIIHKCPSADQINLCIKDAKQIKEEILMLSNH